MQLLPNRQNISKPKKKNYDIGIIFRNSHVIFTKSAPSHEGYQIQSYIRARIKPSLTEEENLIQILPRIPKTFFENGKVTFCTPSYQTSYQRLTLPELEAKDFLFAIKEQVEEKKKYYWQHSVLFENKTTTPITKDILVVKAEKAYTQSYLEIFDRHNISISNIVGETDVIENIFSINAPDAIMLFDLDKHMLKIYIFQERKLHFIRFISIGYEEIINAACKKIRVKDKEVEFTKQNITELLMNNDLFNIDKESYLPLENIFFLIRPILEKISIEIQKSLQYCVKQGALNFSLKAVYIMGDFLKIKNVSQYLSNSIKQQVEPYQFNFSILNPDKTVDIIQKDELALSAAVGIGQAKKEPFSLFPHYYQIKEQIKITRKIVVISFMVWSASLIMIFVVYTLFSMHLKMQINQKKPVLKLLQRRRDQITKKRNLDKQKAAAYKIISAIEKEKLHIEDFLYSLNELDIKQMYLTNVRIEENKFYINGKILTSKSQWLVTHYVDKLERAPDLSGITFEINKNKDDILFLVFSIKGTIIGRKNTN
jgi:Tfp pilus assembly PilM family ATPase